MKVEVIEAPDAFEALQEPWERLLDRYPGGTPFLSFDWMHSWLVTLGREVRPFVIVVREEESVVAIAPFCIREGGLLTFMGYPQNDYGDVLIDPRVPGAIDEIIGSLRSRSDRWRKALLDGLSQDRSSWRQITAALERQGCFFRVEPSDICPALTLDDPGAARKKYYKPNLNNMVNGLKRQGTLTLTVHSETGAALAALEDLFAQHIRRWEGTATPSQFLRPERCKFYHTFVERMHARGWARVASLDLDQDHLAYSVFFEYKGIMYLYRPSHDVRYNKRSPGQVILRFLFDYALEHHIKEMDYARGDERYKDRFATISRRNRRIIIYRNRRSMRLAGAYDRIRRSRLVDILYRNRHVQGLKARLIKLHGQRRRH